MTILVVDDEVSYRLLMKSLLVTEGFDVVLAEDGEEAFSKLDEMQIDLIISDIYMPVMDGFKLHKAVRASEQWKKMPILFVSAYDDQMTLGVVHDPKTEAFLKKGTPFNDIKEWIAYLTSTEADRPSRLPGSRLGSRSAGV